ncbi:MAG: tRNA pseudouridine(13) synthase TruD, partial [Promethearchaeota archaeon]
MQTSNEEREIERAVGIEVFSTPEIEGLGGIYKHNYKDFIVKEITASGKTLDIKEDMPPRRFSRDQKDKFTTFNLVKINTDNFDAIRKIKSSLNIPSDKI